MPNDVINEGVQESRGWAIIIYLKLQNQELKLHTTNSML